MSACKRALLWRRRAATQNNSIWKHPSASAHTNICISLNIHDRAHQAALTYQRCESYIYDHHSSSHCTRERCSTYLWICISVVLIFFKYVLAPMTAFRYCVCCDGKRGASGGWSLCAVGVWISHTRAEVDFYRGWVRRKWKEMESSERASYLAKWNMKFMIAFCSDGTTTSEENAIFGTSFFSF